MASGSAIALNEINSSIVTPNASAMPNKVSPCWIV